MDDLKAHHQKIMNLIQTASNKKGTDVLIVPANRMLATRKNSIVRDGEGTDGSKIGNYSTKPMYATVEQFDKRGSFKPQGKGGKKKGNQPKSMYLEDGYRGLRNVQGKPTDKMNMNYTGSTIASYVTAVESDNALVQGFNNERSSVIRKAQEAKRGNIYTPSAEEKKVYEQGVRDEIARFQKEALR